MPTNFPANLDTFVNPTSSDKLNTTTVVHADQHANLNDAVAALEAKIGVDNSAVATSLTNLIATATAALNALTASLGTAAFQPTSAFDVSGAAASAQAASQPLNSTLTSFAATGNAPTASFATNASSAGSALFASAATLATTANALTTPRAINGVNFDGSAPITVTAAAGTLTGSTLVATVTASSLTSVGTLIGGATGSGFTISFTSSTISGILTSANGGTSNGFAKFSGPTSAEKTYTLPDASCTILTTNAVITIAQGGTGSATQAANVFFIGPKSGSAAAPTWRVPCAADVNSTMYAGRGGMVNGQLGTPTISSNAVTFTLKTAAGSDATADDPIRFLFPSATAATGGLTERTLTAALSVTASSTSTAGSTSGKACRLWLVVFDDAGTLRMAWVNCWAISATAATLFPLREGSLASSTAEGGAGSADSAGVFYTGTAVTTKPYIILGYADFTNTTAGTWATAITVRDYTPGMPLPGDVIQELYHLRNDYAGTTTTVPNDDTIPQITEGAQLFTKAITPQASPNILDMEVMAMYGSSSGGHLYVGFFQDSTANAIMAGWTNANVFHSSFHRYSMVANTTSSTTISFRMGPNATNGGTGSINGFSGSRYLGGASMSYMRLIERQG